MSAVGEQLFDDYLSRLFAAGRGKLKRADRKALVARTSNFIEQTTGPVGIASELDVAKFLAELGDPAGLVDAEEARLAAGRGAQAPGRADRVRGLGRISRRLSAQARLHWPSQPAGSPHLTHSLMAVATKDETLAAQEERVLTGKVIRPRVKLRRRSTDRDGPIPADEVATPESQAADDEYGSPQPAPATITRLGRRPSWPSHVATDASWLDSVLKPDPDEGLLDEMPEGEADELALEGEADAGVLAGAALDREMDESALADEALDEQGDEGELDGAALPAWDVVAHRTRLVARRASLLAFWVADRFRRQPVESVAATLLGIGGAAFPPVWLLGAVVALGSRIWDGRDKWTGLALPVLATILGTVAGVCLTGGASLGHDVHNGWVFADVLSRIAALLGAAYLARRAAHGRRPPAVPPWARPHKVG
jgi:hypothetical protein